MASARGCSILPRLREVRLFRRQYDAVVAQYPQLGERQVIHETIRRMINYIVVDLIRTTQAQLRRRAAALHRRGARAFQAAGDAQRGCREEQLELKQFLNEHVYRHYKVLRMTSKARSCCGSCSRPFSRT